MNASAKDYKKEIQRMLDKSDSIDLLREIYTVTKRLLEKKATT